MNTAFPPPATPAVEARGLCKSYGKQLVLDGVDLDVAQGSVFALLGPNGAGKTTIVHILATLLNPDAGSASIAGHDLRDEPEAVRAAIGVTGQFSAVDELLSGEENLLLMGRLRHLGERQARRRASELLEQFELTEAAKKPLAAFSGGMKRRLDLAMTLVTVPSVIFLDEPTTGLDPRSRRTMWQIVRSIVGEGVTVFLTTQYLEEADELADRVAVLDHGRLVAQGSPAELKRRVGGGYLRLQFSNSASFERAARLVDEATRDDAALALDVPSESDLPSIRRALDRLDSVGVEPDSLTVHTPDLDDVFFALTGAPAAGDTELEVTR